ALDQLARLHVETSEASRLAKLLRNSIHAASLFMLMGTCVLFLGGGATIGQNFSWAALVLIGVVGLIHSYICTNAVAFDRAPVSQAARNLRVTLFYLGIAWGAGAFLAVPPTLSALQAILFAVTPALLLAVVLNDSTGLAAFQAPAATLTILAAFIQSWPDAGLDALVILAVQCGLYAALALRRRNSLPAGLALR
ncbi:MAG: hypothetical protein ABI963_03975, partial [Rhizomicrobium sp.]